MSKNFYKYIEKRGNSYRIIKNGENGVESYGTYSKITDALYERDRLIEANWDWDALTTLEETENFYENMKLPRVVCESSYIQSFHEKFKVYLKRECKGVFTSKKEADKFAKAIGGRVVSIDKRYRVQKRIDGKVKHFGYYKSLEEAKKRRDELIENGWKK